MAINWELGVAPDIIGNALAARREAQDHRQQMERQNALLDMQRQRMSMDQAEITRKQQEQRRADLPLIGRLLEQSTDDATYQQARGVAQQYGIDVSSLPQTFDPAWRDQQLAIVKTLSDPTKMEALSAAGKAAVDMGYKPGTPEFNKAVNEIWAAGESKPYVVGGETRLYTPRLNTQPAAPKPNIISQRPAGLTDEQLFAQAHEAVRQGANVEDVFRQLQAWGVNP